DHRDPAGQVERRWHDHCPILAGHGSRARAPAPGGGRSQAREIGFGPMAQRLDPLASTPPAFDFEAIKRILRDRFGVETSSLAPLAADRDQNLRVDTADGRRLLFKISTPADGLSTVKMQAAA